MKDKKYYRNNKHNNNMNPEKENNREENLGTQNARPNEQEEVATDQNEVREEENTSMSNEEKLAQELEKAQHMLEEQKDKYLRLSAEFDNYRKRTMKEKAELILNGAEKSISSILPIVDDFERALKNIETATDVAAVREGVELIYNMMNVDGSSPTHADSVTQKLSQEGVFLAGKSAMTIGPWMVRSIKDLDNYPHDFVTAFAPYPVYAEGQRNFTQGGYGDMLCINPKSEHIEEAWEFIKWYATEGMLPVVEGGRVPCFNTYDPAEVTAAFLKGGEELLDSETTMTVLINPADNYAAPSITNHSAEIKRVFTEEMETILLGDETPAEGMAKAKERADAILQQ